MKDTPLLFTPENAQKSHDGTKTQTRRIIKPQPGKLVSFFHQLSASGSKENGLWFPMISKWVQDQHTKVLPCPYGMVGDRLWVREAWGFQDDAHTIVQYKASKRQAATYEEWAAGGDLWMHHAKWKPSIHMPKWACRTWLEITDVRVEQIRNISELDCEAELGVPPYSLGNVAYQKFQNLWISINGQESWDRNDWCWVLSYKKVQP